MRRIPQLLLGALAVALGWSSAATAVPMAVPYTGTVMINGSPSNAPIGSLQAAVYTASSGGAAVWTSSEMTNVPVSSGRFQVLLNSGTPGPLGDALLAHDDLWLEWWVGGEALTGRQKLLSVGYAIAAGDVELIGGVMASDLIPAGGDASVGSVTATGAVSVGGSLRVGGTADTCTPAGAGTVRWWAGQLSICDGSSWRGVVTPVQAQVSWSNIFGMPAGFADGVDNEGPQYFPGVGLYTSGAVFHISDTYAQRRVTGSCPTGAISRVNVDGTVTCVTVGQTYMAAAGGGLQIAGGQMSLISCAANQILKLSGGSWACATDSDIASFADVAGMASDSQIPDSITVNYALNAGTVAGRAYNPIWDSTDADSLEGLPPEAFVTSTQLAALQTKLNGLSSSPPSMLQAVCANALPTRVCERDVYLEATGTKNANSLNLLSGGAWTYNSVANRCEYSGGKAMPAPKECGFHSLPSWMTSTDQCGGFRQSTWNRRVWYAVSSTTQWNPFQNYTCPAGYRPMTTAEGEVMFNGPQNAGARVYQSQCGWNARIWNGADRQYFRFIDSAKNNWSFKDVNSFDSQAVQFNDATTTRFAGIICISEAPEQPDDWMYREDSCGGFRVSTFNPNFAFAVARRNLFEPSVAYTCPQGWHWSTTAEAFAAFNNSTVATAGSSRVYQNQCGWSGYIADNGGISRHNFRFSDSYTGATTLAAMHAGYSDEFQVQFNIAREPVSHGPSSPTSYFAGIVCAKDSPAPPSAMDWMDTSDYCGGFRQSSWDPRYFYAVAKSNTWVPSQTYQCPAGYEWVTWQQYQADNPLTSASGSDQRTYQNQCGWSSNTWNGATKTYFRFADSGTSGQPGFNRFINSTQPDGFNASSGADSTTSSFAGIVCRQIGATYPNPGTTDWMQTNDDCKGFRPLHWDPRVRLAVARQNFWNKNYTYTCPAGYHWATSSEADSFVTGAPNPGSTFMKYANQCGWDSTPNWNGRTRVYFRFADSAVNNRFWNASSGETGTWSGPDGTLTSFAGIVCVADNLAEGPLDWWDRSDNCGGFRQSEADPRIRFMHGRKNVWDPNRVYQCPSGYHWVSSAEWASIAPSLGSGAGVTAQNGDNNSTSYGNFYRSLGRCGWSSDSWRGWSKNLWRFSDSHITGRHANGNSLEHWYNLTDTSNSVSAFAGIVCMQDEWEPTFWMDTTDNCDGFRQSQQHPDIWYAVSKSDMWNRGFAYQCPSGFTFATRTQYDTLVNSRPKPSNIANIYSGRCGWNAMQWNPRWQMGCNSYTTLGCGTGHNYGMPSMSEYRLDQGAGGANFASGCTECTGYDTTPASQCQSSGTSSGPDGKCGGINETYWRNGNNINDCFFSPNAFSGNPEGAIPGANSTHEYKGIACGDGEYQDRPLYNKVYFRFADSHLITGQAWYVQTNSKDGTNATNSGVIGQNGSWAWGHLFQQFAGVVCIRTEALP